MKNILDYVETEMNTFANKKFNPVDSLVLSQFSYLYFDNIVHKISRFSKPILVKDLLKAELFDSLFNNVFDLDNMKKFLFLLAASPRFRDIKLNYYENKLDPMVEKQFSAITFIFPDNTIYIAYRGTDANIVGWKEDLNMAFTCPVPSQEEGVAYLNKVAKLSNSIIRVGGHSKGGNIAIYSSLKCESRFQNRIIEIYNHDGPSFNNNILESLEFAKIKQKIHKTIPQSSMVGLIMQNLQDFKIVESNRIGIMQHNPFSWSVSDNDFVYTDNISRSARLQNRNLNQWLETLDNKERELFVDTLFQVFEASEAKTLFDLSKDWQKNAVSILNAIKSIDKDTRKILKQTINDLMILSIRNLPHY